MQFSSLKKTLFILFISLAPCSAVAQDTGVYPPQTVRDYTFPPEYPAQIGEFTRSPDIFYAIDSSNYALGYSVINGAATIHDTLYVYDAALHPAAGAQVTATVAAASPNDTLLGQDEIQVINNNTRYWAKRSAYLSGKDHELYSEIILMEDEYKYIVLKSTVAAAYKDSVTAKNIQLLSAIKWPVNYDYQKNNADQQNDRYLQRTVD